MVPAIIDLITFKVTDLISTEIESVLVDDLKDGRFLLRIGSAIETPRFAVYTDQLNYLTKSTKFGDYTMEIDLEENMNDAILIIAPGKTKKFVVIPHGGPHGMYSTYWNHIHTFFYLNGYSLCLVNYRGSVGYPEEIQRSLPGRVGELDVADIVYHIDAIRKRFHPEKIGIWGWSHGGFLACHIACRHSDIIDFAVAGAPVTNIISSYYSCDIPDWAVVEAGLRCDSMGECEMNEEALQKLWKCSPEGFARDMSTPLLLIHGHNDRRVPAEQSISFYLALKRNHKPVKLLLYEGIGHSHRAADIVADIIVSSVQFFNNPEDFLACGDPDVH